jgi:hypothetical protein
MGGSGVIDQFLNVFTTYIDLGFGLLGGDVRFLSQTLIALDITLAGLFWALAGEEDVIARLIKRRSISAFLPSSSAISTGWPKSSSTAYGPRPEGRWLRLVGCRFSASGPHPAGRSRRRQADP